MKDEIVEFIQRRFPFDCNWLNGNCYYFAQILDSRFMGDIVYDPIDGHFLFLHNNNYYDWSGRREYSKDRVKQFIDWNTYFFKDRLHYNRLWRDCVE